MKRVQALVTGKKKQCTKLPTPAPKGQKSPTTSTSGPAITSEPAGSSGSHPGTLSAKDDKPTSPTGSVSSAGSTLTAGSNSSLSTASTASSVRGVSKIPASSPRKGGKDVVSSTSTKSRARQDVEEKAKPKKEELTKKGSKKEVKVDTKVPSREHVFITARKSTVLAEPPLAKASENEPQPEVKVDQKQESGAERDNELKVNEKANDNVDTNSGALPSLEKDQSSAQSAEPSVAKPQTQNGKVPQAQMSQSQPDASVPPQKPQHIQGILKDTSGSRKAYNAQAYIEGGHGGPANGTPYDGHAPYQSSRGDSSRGNMDPVYQQGYGSMSRSSRSTTPTQDNIYSYGSLHRRPNASTPTQANGYFNGWGSLTRKAESDFHCDSLDRNANYQTISYGHHNGPQGGRNYTVVNYQTSRPGSVPPHVTDVHNPLYGEVVSRPGSVPPHYYSDNDAQNYYRGTRGGSVPVGYESESSAYGSLGSTNSRPRHHDSDTGFANGAPGMKVHPDDEQYRAGPGKRPIPRRHTVGVSGSGTTNSNRDPETERKREAFMQLLAQRYPQYADKIQGTGGAQTPPQQVERPARSREIQRRRTAVVTYDPHQAGHTLEYDDQGTMSDLELPSFQRGGFTRTSLPIVRSASTSLERPLGLVFLVYGDQTKKSLLPNEITTLDTVRALFVRAFPDLNLEMLENPRKKIYLLDPATNIYFQLEDLAEIKDRSVLKIHETDNDEPQRVREKQEVRGRTVQMPVSRSHSRGPFGDVPATALDVVKSHSLPPQVSHNYQELMQEQQNQWERRSRSRTPEPADRPRSLSAGSSSRQRFSHSPDRLPTPERAPLNPIPENRQLLPGYQDPGNYYEPVGPAAHRGPYPAPVYDVPASYQGYPPASPGISQQTYLTRSTRAPPLALPQRAIGPAPDPREAARLGNRQGLPYAPNTPNGTYQQRSQSFRIPASERDGTDLVRSHSVAPSDDTTSRNRIEKMEQQLASLTAWVHYQKADGVKAPVQRPSSASSLSDSSETFPISSASSLSDIPDGYQGSSGISSRESTPLSAQAEVTVKLAQLKSDLHVLRRQQQLNMEAMKEEFLAVGNQIKKVLSSVPESENQLNFHNRNEVTLAKHSYNQEKEKVHKELSDLEASVEELRTDVLSRQCRVNSVDVEGMALLLSNVTKSLAELKARFPELQSQLKSVMDAEMRLVVSEEKFLKEEPTEIEGCLKRCKKLTNTLYTLKRLASVQDHRPSQVPQMPTATNAVDDDQKNALLENIRSLVPDHDQRVHQIEAAEAARERKKKISTQQEALKFGKTLELASKNLRPPSATGDRIQDSGQPVAEDQGSSKPAIAAKPVLAQVTTSMAVSLPYTTIASVANVASVKPSFSTAPSSSKPIEKPTATVSAMTSSVSDSVTTTAAKPTTETTSVPYMTKSAALTETTGRLSSISGGSDGIKVGSDTLKKTEPSIYTYQVCGPVNPVIPFPPMFKPTSFESTDKNGTSSSEKVQTLAKSSEPVVEKSETKKLSVSFSESSPTFIPDEHSDPYKNTNCTDSEKTDPTSEKQSSIQSSQSVQKPVDLATQKQAARSAFFSSLNSPPTSPTMNSPSRNSASLDPGPVITPTGVVGKIGTGPTINLVLTGCASPKSPTSPGTFTISPPKEIFYPPVEMRRPSPKASPSRDLLKLNSESRSSGSDTSDSSQTDGKKKVPPPPPPRKGSRPTSASVVSPTFKSQDMPRFVGGVLGQHRLSGGPLSSTPKPIFAQRPLSKFEKDISSGLYANINKVEPPSQAGSVQQRLSEANVQKPESDNNNIYDASIPPPPSVTIPFDREERGSSSDSTSSSSGTSMGSQQSVVSVVQSASVNYRPVTKPKPDPPRRQSSLLSKFTGDKDDKLNNGNANLNGVDL
ncbi:uncharacterized protein LOC106065710 isoform X5 [Biomphalaria glabrata]|uniref:Uncharacterized protein LOC106065710 isoform X5 n=1 Tax=Biomphalaria glabrata TaxID=6526 RepID=A0A9W2ZN64_BIOGL|nr:uncharacterized protein LOC106065710 isoform X5 [Biomphalaria glabrata]